MSVALANELQLGALAGLKITHEQGAFLAELAAGVSRDLAIVEIGTYKGKSACYLASGAQSGNGAHVFAIDRWDSRSYGQDSIFRKRGILDICRQQIESVGLTDSISLIRGDARKVARRWRLPIGLLFHDAWHDYGSVRDDLRAWLPHVVSGGWVLCHDYRNPRWASGVTRYVDERLSRWPDFRVVGWTAAARKP